MANEGPLGFEDTLWKTAGKLLGSGTIADAIEVLPRAKGEMRAIKPTAALQDSGKLLRTDSASATLHKTPARDGRFGKVQGCRGYRALGVPPLSHRRPALTDIAQREREAHKEFVRSGTYWPRTARAEWPILI